MARAACAKEILDDGADLRRDSECLASAIMIALSESSEQVLSESDAREYRKAKKAHAEMCLKLRNKALRQAGL